MRWMAYRQMIVAGLIAITVAAAAAQKDDVEARAMHDEMQRSMQQLQLEGEQKPYFISYKIADSERLEAQASFGALTGSSRTRSRVLYVTVRVGDYDLDNTGGGSGAGSSPLLALTTFMGGIVMLPRRR